MPPPRPQIYLRPRVTLRFDLTHVSSAITSAQTFFMGSHYAEIAFADGADPPPWESLQAEAAGDFFELHYGQQLRIISIQIC